MKILQIGKFYPIIGGVEKVMFNLTSGFAAVGVECPLNVSDCGSCQYCYFHANYLFYYKLTNLSFVFWALPKLLALRKAQINLAFRSFFRNFAVR